MRIARKDSSPHAAGLTHTEVGIVAPRRFAPRTAAQRLWRRVKSRENAVPPLHGAGLSQRDNLYLTLLTQPLPRYASALPHAPSGVTESATRRESVLTGTMQKNGDGARSRIYFAPFARTSAFLCLKSDRIVPDKTGCNPHTRFRNGFGVDIECRFATVSRLILI